MPANTSLILSATVLASLAFRLALTLGKLSLIYICLFAVSCYQWGRSTRPHFDAAMVSLDAWVRSHEDSDPDLTLFIDGAHLAAFVPDSDCPYCDVATREVIASPESVNDLLTRTFHKAVRSYAKELADIKGWRKERVYALITSEWLGV